MKANEVRKEIDVDSLGSGTFSCSWLQTVLPFRKLILFDNENKIGFVVVGDSAVVTDFSLDDFKDVEVYKRVDGMEAMINFWTPGGQQMSVVAEVMEKEEIKVVKECTAFEKQKLLAEDIIANVFKGQKIVPSVEWFNENCLHNGELDEFVGKWLSKNDPNSALKSLYNGVFETNVQIGALVLTTYLRLANLDAELCESILRRVLDKPKK